MNLFSVLLSPFISKAPIKQETNCWICDLLNNNVFSDRLNIVIDVGFCYVGK